MSCMVGATRASNTAPHSRCVRWRRPARAWNAASSPHDISANRRLESYLVERCVSTQFGFGFAGCHWRKHSLTRCRSGGTDTKSCHTSLSAWALVKIHSSACSGVCLWSVARSGKSNKKRSNIAQHIIQLPARAVSHLSWIWFAKSMVLGRDESSEKQH